MPGDTVKCWNGKNRSSYRAFGADQLAETDDDIRLEVVFDNWGRTVSTYTTNTDITRILGQLRRFLYGHRGAQQAE